MAACRFCGSENPESARFCGECGASLEEGCPDCGAPLKPGLRFCPSCGARLKKEDEADAGQMLKLVTVLFADVVSSTARAERMYPEDIRALMTDFLDAMSQEIRAEGGRIEKFIGDAVMAVFGIPAAHEDDPLRAVNAGRRMLDRLEEWNVGRDPLEQIQIRIGINTGEVLATGTPGQDLMVTGDCVNVAARLEQTAQTGTIVIGSRTATNVRPFFLLRELEPLALKGKAKPEQAFLVEDAKLVVEPRGLPGISAPLIGRQSQLAMLKAILDRVEQERSAHLATIIGDAGVGKSRLVREFTSLDSGAKVVLGRCLPYGEGITLWPLAEILKAETGMLHDDPQEVAFEKIEKLVKYSIPPDLQKDPELTVASLASTIGLEVPGGPLESLDPREVFRELLYAWRALFTALAQGSRLVVVVDDIHWADATMLDVLEDMARHLRSPVLFLCTARPDLIKSRPTWGAGLRNYLGLPLDPLTTAQSAELLSSLLVSTDLPPELKERILNRSEGNAFFLEEIIRRLIDEGHLRREADTWVATSGIADVDIPDTVQGVILARLDLLDRLEKKVIQHAAVIGREFWASALEDVASAADVDEVLRALEQRELVAEHLSSSMAGQVEYSFKHILIRDVAYETLPRRARAKAHVAAANWIRTTSGERSEELAEVIAHHFHQAYGYSRDEEVRRQGRHYALIASRNACHRFASHQAEVLGWLAVDLSNPGQERVDALEGLGNLLCLSLAMDGAWKVFNDAIAEVRQSDPMPPSALARLASKAAIVPTRWDVSMRSAPPAEEITRVIEAGLDAAPEGDSSERSLLLASKAFLQIGGYEEKDEIGRKAAATALEIAERLGDPDLISAALDATATWLLPDGRHGEINRINRRRVALVPQLTDIKEICDAYLVEAWSSTYMGQYRRAVEAATLLVERARGVDPGSYVLGLMERTHARFATGDWDGALEDQSEIERIEGEDAKTLPSPHVRPAYALAMFCRQLRGDTSLADQYDSLLEACDVEDGGPAGTRSGRRSATRARALAHRGDTQAARAMISLQRGPLFGYQLQALCDVLALQENPSEAEKVVELARADAAASGLLGLPFFADRLDGKIHIARGETMKGVDLLRRSVAGFSELDAPWEAATSRLLLGETLLQLRDGESAAAELRRASSCFESLSSVVEAKRAAELLAALPAGV